MLMSRAAEQKCAAARRRGGAVCDLEEKRDAGEDVNVGQFAAAKS